MKNIVIYTLLVFQPTLTFAQIQADKDYLPKNNINLYDNDTINIKSIFTTKELSNTRLYLIGEEYIYPCNNKLEYQNS